MGSKKTASYVALALALAFVGSACNGDMHQDSGAPHDARDTQTIPDGSDAHTTPDDVTSDGNNGGEDVVSMVDGGSDSTVSTPGATCDDSIVLMAGVARPADETPAIGIPGTACRPSDAPQRFYSFDIPTNTRAIVRVTPAGSWRATLRVYQHCDLTQCITDGQSDSDGAPVDVVIDNTTDAVLHKTITVSGAASDQHGMYAILATLESFTGGDGGDVVDVTDGGSDTGAVDASDGSSDTGPMDSGMDGSASDGGMTDGGAPGTCGLAMERALVLPNDSFDGMLDGANRIPSSRCGATSGGEDIFPLHIDARTGVQFTADTGAVILSLRRACADATSETSCYSPLLNSNGSSHVSILREVLEPGDYFVIADTDASAIVTYHLTLTTFVPPPESMCATGPELAGSMSYTGNTEDGGPANTTCAPQPGSQAFYRLTMPARSRYRVRIFRGSNRVPLVLRVMDGCGASSACLEYAEVFGGDLGNNVLFVDNVSDTEHTFIISISSTRVIGADYTVTAAPYVLPDYQSNAVCANATVVGNGTSLTNQDASASGTVVACRQSTYTGPNLFYRANVAPGQLFSFVANSSSFGSDLVLRSLDACGATTCGQVVNLGEGATPEVMHFLNTTGSTQSYLVAVGSTLPSQPMPFDVRSAIATPVPNAACHTPTIVSATTTYNGLDFEGAWSMDSSSIVNHVSHSLYYQLDIPNDQDVQITATPNGPTTPRLLITPDCSTTSALAYGSNDADGTGRLFYANHSGSTQHVLLQVYAASGYVFGAFDLHIEFPTPVTNGTCANAAVVTDGASFANQDVGYGHENAPDCGVGATGSVLFYRASVPAGQQLTVTASGSIGQWDPFIEVFDSCGASSCLAAANDAGTFRSEAVMWSNTGSTARDVIVAIGNADPMGGRLNIGFRIQPPSYTSSAITGSCDTMPSSSTVLSTALGSAISLPFAFSYFGVAETSAVVSPYGYLRLEPVEVMGAGEVVTQTVMPTRDGWNNIVAPFWTGLGTNESNTSQILANTFGSGSSRHLTVEWSHMTTRYFPQDPAADATFQVKLFEGSNRIEFHYCSVVSTVYPQWANGGEASIGLENGRGDLGVKIGYYRPGAVASGGGYSFVPLF